MIHAINGLAFSAGLLSFNWNHRVALGLMAFVVVSTWICDRTQKESRSPER